MKSLYIVSLRDEADSGEVCDLLKNKPDSIAFPGCWGEISYNESECISSICGTVNHLIESDKYDIIVFGCNIKDIKTIRDGLKSEKLNISEISLNELKQLDFIRSDIN